MAQYTDEENAMNVTRLLLVLSTSQYGDVVLDVSHWSGSQAKIATQTYHFPNSLDLNEFSNSSELPTPDSIDQYTQLELIENNDTFFTNSSQFWQTAIHISKGNELYGGTSINGGLFLIQTNAQPSTNSTMLSIHQNGQYDEFIQFEQVVTDSSMIVMLDNLEIRIDWNLKSVVIE